MQCAQQIPKTKAQNIYDSLKDKNYNWSHVREKYTTDQLESMKTWLAEAKLNDPLNCNENAEFADFEKLNKYQRFTYDIVKKHKEEEKQLLMILLGSAGTGKSFTVSALTKLNEGKIKKASPTAKAAFLINGQTIHSLFNIPVTNSELEEFIPLENENLAKLQADFEEVEILVIDEFSMMSQIMFAKIDSRLRQAKNNNKMFGGISIILIGDPGQLLPVKGSTLYDQKLNNQMSIAGFLAYKAFKIVIQLQVAMRQLNENNDPDQAQFIELLPRLRNGTSTINDWKLLQTRVLTSQNKEEFSKAISIFNENDDVDECNIKKLAEKKTQVTELIAYNSNKKAKSASSQHFGGLANSIYLSNECDIIITTNLWASKG
jgi:hypothetical protein